MIKKLMSDEHFLKKMVWRRDVVKALALSALGIGVAPAVFAQTLKLPAGSFSEHMDDHIRDYLHKMKNFDAPHDEDIKIEQEAYPVFQSTVQRLHRLEQFVGHLNFQIIGFDEGIRIARRYADVGKFTEAELGFMEMIFYHDASLYGFLGEKTMTKLTDSINKNDVIKIPDAGNYLYRGIPHQTLITIRQQVSEGVVLTSGVRGIMKQFLLFLSKADMSRGNLSLASRSLAPPGYSFHANGDFDVGQDGLGVLNFTEKFTETEVYTRLTDLGYLKLRYKLNNPLGVRFEPWHIKIT